MTQRLLWLVFSVACAAPKHTAPGAIGLDLRAAPIHDALRLLAASANTNLTVDPDVTGEVTIAVRARPWREVLDQIVATHDLAVHEVNGVLRISNASTAVTTTTFTGTPIAVDFNNTPLGDAVKTIANAANVEIVVDDGIDDRVTMRLRSAPWDFALDHLVRKYGLRMIRDGGRIRITK
jgi:type II secretory pathway component HofQ